MIEINQHRFEHGAMSIIQMGEELIGHPTTAINELIKNGYDADAFEYWVYFNYASDIGKTFVFGFDNGLGMGENILFGNWLYPSISSKRIGEGKSPILKRTFLGSKGIGRLAAMALGRYLTVISKTNDEAKYNWLVIDREKFRKEDLLTKVTFPGGQVNSLSEIFENEEINRYKGFKSSTKLLSLLSDKQFKDFNEGTIIIVEYLDSSVKAII